MQAVELRCPQNYGRLFAKFLVPGVKLKIVEGNLVEFACRDCRKHHTEQDGAARAVFHRFDIAGQLVETEIVFTDSRKSILLRVDP